MNQNLIMMRMKNRILIYQLLILVMLTITSSSCKKDDTIKKDVIITWANPEDINVGTALSATQLNATADVPGTFAYTPAIGTVLDLSNNQTLQVVFTPIDDVKYNTSTMSVSINVVKRNPIITWSNPSDITLPTPLSAIQLNATADVEGTFVYTPAIGTVLSIGAAQELKVDFTPTDVINCDSATISVIITVKATGTITDYDGNVYSIVEIGTQTWMVENLKVTHYRNGKPIDNVIDNNDWTTLTSGAFCWYNNEISNKNTYGALYNWFALNDSRNIAPDGWHVPTDADWTTLTTFLGGENEAGGKMKEIGTTHWVTPNTGANNISGFSAIASGERDFYNGTFYNLGYSGTWWSSNEIYFSNALFRNLFYTFSYIFPSNQDKKSGYSVRCVKD
jgi:uncharacterized protein (TIGR02145 family)